MENKKRLAKAYLADKGIRVFQKDMDAVDRFYTTGVRHNTKHGTHEFFHHRELYVIFMNNGTQYEVLRETVDKDGNFSTNSAKFITQSVRMTPASMYMNPNTGDVFSRDELNDSWRLFKEEMKHECFEDYLDCFEEIKQESREI